MMQRRAFAAALGAVGSGLLVAPSRGSHAAEVPATARAVDAAYFGMHFHRLVRKPGEPAPTSWPEQATIGALRLWDCDTRWADLAPQPGRWDFDRMDAYVARAAAQGASILYTLGSTPRWASARPGEPGPYGPGCAAEPRSLADWDDYVRRVVDRYRGVVRAYELWNEPNFSDMPRDRGVPGFFTGSVAAMVEMGRVARRAIDEIDPRARLATPGFVNGPDRLELFLKAGGASVCDAVAYHLYSKDANRFTSQLAEVREVMRSCGVSHLPLWNTECGVETQPGALASGAVVDDPAGEAGAAALVAQLLLLGAAAGIERFDYYAWDNGHTGMIDPQGRPRPRLAAFAQTQQWLLGSRLAAAGSLPGGQFRLWGERDRERFVFVWADQEGSARLRMPPGWRASAVHRLLEPAPVQVDPAQAGAGSMFTMPVSPRPARLLLAQNERVGS